MARTGHLRVRPHAGPRDPAGHAARRHPGRARVWMSHGDAVAAAPTGFDVLASTAATPVAAFEDIDRRLAGVQWHPEVMHTEHGQRVLEHFLSNIAGCRPTWTMVNIVEEQVERIREQIGDSGRAICGLSGGVDSAVAAAVVQRAIGDRLTCVFVDHGLLRKGEAEQVERDFVAATGVDLHVVDAAEALPRRPRRGQRPRGEAQDHRPRVHPGLRGGRGRRAPEGRGRGRPEGRVPRPGHALPRRGRVRRGSGHLQHQVPPQRRRPARRPRVRAGRAAAHAVQGRGPPRRRAARPARRDRLAAPVPRARASASGSSARSPASASTSCARPTRSPARSSPAPGSTATSGSSRSCSSPTSARSGSRATAAPTATPSCCARSPPRTP